MKTTLKTRLIFTGLFSIFITALAMVVISSIMIRSNSLSNTEEQIRVLSDTFANDKAEWLADRRNAVKSLGRTLEKHSDDSPYPYLQQIHQAMGFGLTYYGNEKGEMYRQDPGADNDGQYDPRERPWYKGAKDKGAMFVTEPYVSTTMQALVITLSEPVKLDNQFYGVVGANVAIDKLTSAVRKLMLPGDGFGILVEQDGTIISHPNAELNGKSLTTIDKDFNEQWIKHRAEVTTLESRSFNGYEALFYVSNIPNTSWYLVFSVNKSVLMEEANQIAGTLVGVGCVLLVLFGILLFTIFRLQFRDLEKVSAALQDIAHGEGDLTVRIQTKHSHDELGILADGFNQFVMRLHGIISKMQSVATQLSHQAHEASASSELTSNSISTQQDEVTMVATAVTQMATATEDIANNAETTATTAENAVNLTAMGRSQVQKSQSSIVALTKEVSSAGEIINTLSDHSKRINTILATIQDIADQTNLLALNAAIEAARAGDHGRGFAVVADEVRSLSQRTQSSTQEIQSTIETLQKTATMAVDSMEKSHHMAEKSVRDAEVASENLANISEAIQQISDMASQIATAAEEQTLVTSEINRNTESIREVSESLSHESVQSKHKARELSEVAKQLQQEVGKFKL